MVKVLKLNCYVILIAMYLVGERFEAFGFLVPWKNVFETKNQRFLKDYASFSCRFEIKTEYDYQKSFAVSVAPIKGKIFYSSVASEIFFEFENSGNLPQMIWRYSFNEGNELKMQASLNGKLVYQKDSVWPFFLFDIFPINLAFTMKLLKQMGFLSQKEFDFLFTDQIPADSTEQLMFVHSGLNLFLDKGNIFLQFKSLNTQTSSVIQNNSISQTVLPFQYDNMLILERETWNTKKIQLKPWVNMKESKDALLSLNSLSIENIELQRAFASDYQIPKTTVFNFGDIWQSRLTLSEIETAKAKMPFFQKKFKTWRSQFAVPLEGSLAESEFIDKINQEFQDEIMSRVFVELF